MFGNKNKEWRGRVVMELRLEEKKDYFEVENLTREAFWDVYRPGCEEHLILHKLRKTHSFIKELDYVVIEDNKIVGSIVYNKVFFGDKKEMSNEVIGFGPISVAPEYQGKGIGKKLIEVTADKAKEMGYKAILITGNDKYYNKLGFVSASKFGVHLAGMPLDDEATFFMAKELEKGYLAEHAGIYDFDPTFAVSKEELEEFDKQFKYKEKREPRDTDL